MEPFIFLIDKIMIKKGKRALKDIDKYSHDPKKANEELLLRLLKDNKDTEYGKKYDFAHIKSIDEYCQKVPFSSYDDYYPFIKRMIKGKERNLITAYDIMHYAETSGTIGAQKLIPVTSKSMRVYQKYSFARTKAIADQYFRKNHNHQVPYQRGLNTVEVESDKTDDGVYRGTVTGSVARRYRKIFKAFLTSPDPVHFPIGGMNMNYMKARFALEEPNLVFMLSVFMTNLVDMMNYIKKNWEMIVDDIEHGTINEKVCDVDRLPIMKQYVRPNPKRAKELREIFKQGFDTPIIPKLWPKMSWACGIGNGGFTTYLEKFKKFAGENVGIDYFVYAASEGMFAACYELNNPNLILLPDSCFFEFLPVESKYDAKTLTIDQLEKDKEYEVIITNQAGFYRYRINDVIRVLGFHNKCPLVTFAYRKGQLINVAAEKTTEEHLREAMKRFSKEIGCEINDYALYLDTESHVSRYVILIEPEQPLEIDKDGKYGELLQKILCEVNPEYGFISGVRGSIDKPLVLIQQKETHALWREFKIMKGSSANQVKPVRILDTPVKQKFFLGLLEPNQKVPNWNVYNKRKQ